MATEPAAEPAKPAEAAEPMAVEPAEPAAEPMATEPTTTAETPAAKRPSEDASDETAAKVPKPDTATDAAMEELVGKLGYSKFLEMSTKQLMKQWATLHPDPAAAKKEEK